MSDLAPRSGGALTPRQREQRAYRLVLASGALAAVAVAGVVLAILGVIGGTIPVVAAILAVVCVILLRRTLRP
jgi:CHASE2 domain-containing sensor protein